MEITKILFIAVLACALVVLINPHRPEFTLIIRLAAVCLIVAAVSDSFSQVIQEAVSLSDGIKINNEYIYLLVKALVIAIACRIISDICLDTGNKAIATCVDLAGQLSVMLLAIPLLSALSQLAKELIKE